MFEPSRQELKEIFVTAVVYLTIDLMYIHSKTEYFRRYFKKIQGSAFILKKSAVLFAYILFISISLILLYFLGFCKN